MQSITQTAQNVNDSTMPKDWMQIRIERETAQSLDDIHIERRESYNDIIKRLVKFWEEHHDKP